MAMTINFPVRTYKHQLEAGTYIGFSPQLEGGTYAGFSLEPATSIQDHDLDVEALILSLQTITLQEGTGIPGSDLMLRYGLVGEMEVTRDGFVMGSGDLDEWSFGATYEEAYLEFLTSLRDRYYSLSRREDLLSPQDLSILEKLRSLLIPR